MTIRPAILVALVALAVPAHAAEGDISPDLLTKPLDMMVDEAARRAGAAVPAPEASAAERALGLFQRGFYADARTAALEAIELDDGAGAAMMLLATMSGAGLGTPRDDAQALQWTERAAERGNPEARHALAIRRITGEGVATDRDAGVVELRALAPERAEAAFDLAQLLLSEGDGEGEEWLDRAARAGVPEAQYALAGLLMSRADGQDAAAGVRADALEWMVSAARSGLAEAQLELGLWLVEGRGAPSNPAAAFGWVERAALAGLPLARNRLAHLHRVGIGTVPDPVRAARWHALARFDGVADPDLDAVVRTLKAEDREKAFSGLPPAAVSAVTTAPPEGAPLPPTTQRNAQGLPGVRLGAD